MVIQTASSDVAQAFLEHFQPLGVRKNLDRFQDRLKSFCVNYRKRLLVVARDPNHSILTQPLIQSRKLFARFRDVESGRSHNEPSSFFLHSFRIVPLIATSPSPKVILLQLSAGRKEIVQS